MLEKYGPVMKPFGLRITIKTTATSPVKACALFKSLLISTKI
jgi:hypothetical protein